MIARLIWTELKLFAREPLSLTFVFAFPILTVLILAGVFDADDPAFEGVDPSSWYIAGYLGVVLAAIGLIMLPVRIASYREQGVVRRFRASAFPRWALAVAHTVVALTATILGITALLATAGAVYGIPIPEHCRRSVAGVVAGALCFVAIGALLGSVLPTARAAQSVGLLLFFPSFLLGGGGPPPSVMSPAMVRVADVLPLSHAIRAVQEPWLGLGTGSGHLAAVLAVTVAAAGLTVLATRRTA